MKQLPAIGCIAGGLVLVWAGWSGWSQERWINRQNIAIATDLGTTPRQHGNPLWPLLGISGLGALASGLLLSNPPTVSKKGSFPVTSAVAEGKTASKKGSLLTPQVQGNSSPSWLDRLTDYPCLLIYGAQGSGKTTLAAEIVGKRLGKGHIVQVLDPHKKAGHWQGLECFGTGMDYIALSDKLRWFSSEVQQRYKRFGTDPDFDAPPLTLVCDEFTNWANRCDGADEFFSACLSDIRKVNLHVIFISHARTMTALGNSKGLAAARDSALVEVELKAKIDPKTGKASPAFEGMLKLPGQDLSRRSPIRIDPIAPSFDFRSVSTSEHSGDRDTEWLNSLMSKEYGDSEPDEYSELNDPLDPLEPSSQSKGRLVRLIRSGVPKQRAICSVWNCKPGGSKAYQKAEAFYKDIKQSLGV